MSRTLDLIDRIATYCEAGEVDKAALVCLRLARSVRDTYTAVLFLRELYPDEKQLASEFFHETEDLNDEARKFVWENTLEHWAAERKVPDRRNPKKVLLIRLGVGELQKEIEQLEKAIDDLQVPPGMGEFDTAAFTDAHNSVKRDARVHIRALNEILQRIRTRCIAYATRIERQLTAQENTSNLVSDLQTEVHNYYANRSEQAYQSMRKAASLLGSSNPEDHALLLTSIRRAVKAVADYHYPPLAEPVVCSDGSIRVLGEDQYLNRIEEFCRSTFGSDKSSKMLKSELDYLLVFVRRLNEVASKGVHSDVSHAEARQGLLGLYIFLSNLIIKLQYTVPEAVESTGETSISAKPA